MTNKPIEPDTTSEGCENQLPLQSDPLEKKWSIPSFIIRDYRFGYERECTEYLFGGEAKKGARQSIEEQLERIEQRTLKAA